MEAAEELAAKVELLVGVDGAEDGGAAAGTMDGYRKKVRTCGGGGTAANPLNFPSWYTWRACWFCLVCWSVPVMESDLEQERMVKD